MSRVFVDPNATEEKQLEQLMVMWMYDLRHKYGLSTVPRKDDSDPRAVALLADPEFIEAQQAYGRAYRAANWEIVKERWRQWYHTGGKELRDSYNQAYRQAHKVEAAAYAKDWQALNRVHLNLLSRQWAIKHPEVVASYRHSWWQAHHDKMLEYGRQRRSRARYASGDFTEEEFRQLCSDNDYCCSYCGGSEDIVGRLVPDHITPLISDGLNSIDNITPACFRCNSSKGSKSFDEYMSFLEDIYGSD